MWYWLLHHFGIDTTTGRWYAFWSGAGSDISELAILGALLGGLKQRNCHVKGCRWTFPFTHQDPEHGWHACRRHHSKAHKLL